MLVALANHGLKNESDCIKVGEFLVTLSKASNFDMTLMFIDDKEKKELSTILKAL